MCIGLATGPAGLAAIGAAAGVQRPYWVVVVSPVAVGFGMSFTMPTGTTTVMEGEPAERGGLASGIINAARQVGVVIGVALLVADRVPFGDLRVGVGIAAGVSAL